MRHYPSILRNHLGEQLDFSLHRATSDDAPIAIIGHGVTGHKDRPLLVALAEELAENGIDALRISYSGNGGSAGRFEESTVLKEVQELGAVIDALPPGRIGYIGHSMGAAVGALRAASDPRIQFLVSISGIAHTAAFAEREFGALKPGDLMWEKPGCILSQPYLEAMKKTGSVIDSARRIRTPWLLVHGTADDVVPFQDSLDVCASAPGARLLEIDGADHLFSGADHTPEAVRAVVDWLTGLKL